MEMNDKPKLTKGTATDDVLAIGKLNFIGNIIPNSWYDKLKLESGKTDSVSLLLLSEIVYWYRPAEVRSEKGNSYSFNKRFKSDLLQKGYTDLSNKFGFSTKQIRESLKRLESMGLIKRVFRTIIIGDTPAPNGMFIQIFPNAIAALTEENHDDITCDEDTHPSFPQRKDTPHQSGKGILPSRETYPSPKGKTSFPEGKDIQRIQLEITSKNRGGAPPPARSPRPPPQKSRSRAGPDNGVSEGEDDGSIPPHKNPSAGEVGEGKKNQGAEGPENKNPETESPETGAGIEKDPEGELDDKPNSTARCEERFHAPWPKGDWGQADRRFLNSPEGVKLRQILNGAGIEPERWVDFLHYWAKESQFANWKGNEAWKQKTDI